MSCIGSQGCPNCPSSFTQHNPPRQLINCEHLMCQRCLISQKTCKKCGSSVGLQDHFLKDYTIVNLSDILNRPSQSSIRKTLAQSKIVVQSDNLDQDQLLNQSVQENQKQQQKSQQIYIEQCLLHSKPADLICLDDNAIICSSCALFGKHKGHEVSNRQGILTKFTCFVEDCLKIYDQLKQKSNVFSFQTHKNQYKKMLMQKKQNDQKKISQKFQTLISMIKIIEKKQLLKISELYKEKERVLEQSRPKMQKIQTQVKKWMEEIEDIGSLMSATASLQKLVHCIPYIDQKTQIKRQIMNKGSILIQKFEETQKQFSNQLKKQREAENLRFDEDKIKIISQYVTIKNQQVVNKRAESVSKMSNLVPKSPICPQQMSMRNRSSYKKEHLRTETDAYEPPINSKLRSDITVNCFNDDNLLLSVQHPIISLKTEQRRQVYVQRVQIAEELDAQNIPHLSISDIRPVTTMSSGQSSQQSRFIQKDRELREFVNDNLCSIAVQIAKQDPKKKKKTDIPQKFKGAVDDLKNDRAQTIDLTGAEVGDASILSLCPFIRKSKKLKTLKLVKNKLTDDCLGELFEALAESKVCSLNLSQNLLTDKCCLIISSSQISQNLKTITLSLNKVNRRNVKNKIDELGKKNITLLL